MKFIRDIISEKKQSILKQNQDQAENDKSLVAAPVADQQKPDPEDVPDLAAALTGTESANGGGDTGTRKNESAPQSDDLYAEEDLSSFSTTLGNVFADNFADEDEFEEDGENALSVFDDILADTGGMVDEAGPEDKSENATEAVDTFAEADLGVDLGAQENAVDTAAFDANPMTKAPLNNGGHHQEVHTPNAQTAMPETTNPRQEAIEDPADNPFSTPAGQWNSPFQTTPEQAVSPAKYRPVPGEGEAGQASPLPRAMAQPAEMPSTLQPVEVPAPASGRVSSRTTRVKTRLLGFNPSQSTVSDPFSTDVEQPSSSHSKFPVGWLAVIKGPGRGATFTIFAGVTHLGRGEGQGVRLDFGDNSISRSNHAAVAYDPEQQTFYVGHGGKANLVRRNDLPVLSTEELLTGDLIRIGETTLRFIALCGPDFGWEDHRESEIRHVSNS